MRFREKVGMFPTATPLGTFEWKWTYEPESAWRDMNPPASVTTYYPASTRQYTDVDRSWDNTHAGPPYRTGSPFDKWGFRDHGYKLTEPCETVGIIGSMMRRYRGRFLCPLESTQLGVDFDFPGVPSLAGSREYIAAGTGTSFGDPSSYGPTAWNRFRPGQSVADAGVFIGEIKEIPRMLMTTARIFRDRHFENWTKTSRKKFHHSAKEGASNWLNTQYGWLPFLSDMRKFFYAWQNADKLINQLKRDNDKWIMRSGTVTQDRDEEIYKEEPYPRVRPWYTTAVYPDPSNPGKTIYTKVVTDKVWFSAKFKYHIPDIESVVWNANARRVLFGATVNPALLWELTPWSWLVDWFSNVGDVLSNLDNELAENLAAKYAYIMRTKTYRVDVEVHQNLSTGPQVVVWPYELHRKCRQEANPFGFGLTWDDLSTRQWSILGALGITRTKS